MKVPDSSETGPWIGLRETPTPEWSDKSSANFFFWANGQPNTKNEACGQMITSGKWADDKCEKQHPYVCQKGRTYSFCAAAAEEGSLEECGYVGVRKRKDQEEALTPAG